MHATHSRQRTVPVTCSTSASHDLRRIGHRRRPRRWRRPAPPAPASRTSASASRHAVGGRLHQRAMERRGHRQQHGALGALRLGDLDRALDRRLVRRRPPPAPPPLSLATSQTSPLRRLRAPTSRRGLEVEPEQRRHGAVPDRHRLLHGVAADAQQPRGVGDRERAGGGERRILAERMAGDEGGVARKVEPGLGLEHAHRRQRHRHQRRLGVRGQRQRLGRALPDQPRELFAERRRRPRRRPRAPRERRRPAPCPCRPPGCPAPETRMPAPCVSLCPAGGASVRATRGCQGEASSLQSWIEGLRVPPGSRGSR